MSIMFALLSETTTREVKLKETLNKLSKETIPMVKHELIATALDNQLYKYKNYWPEV